MDLLIENLQCLQLQAFSCYYVSSTPPSFPLPPSFAPPLLRTREAHRPAHARCGCQRVGWACVYSSAGCCWLLMFLGKCNGVPTAIGINITVGLKVSFLTSEHAVVLTVWSCCLVSDEEMLPSFCWLLTAGVACLANASLLAVYILARSLHRRPVSRGFHQIIANIFT